MTRVLAKLPRKCERMKLGVGMLALLAASTVVVAQGTLGYLKDAPATYFNKDDRKMMSDAVAEVIESTEPGTTRTWENAATGSNGRIKALSSFDTADGRECRRLKIENHSKKGGDGASTMNFCRVPDGKWLMDPDARPAPRAAP